ncbi:MAG: hypothetical protein HY908_37480 [Myxococcales bacterium]|nr:hypothetical protein [Myxococcales bacterium]
MPSSTSRAPWHEIARVLAGWLAAPVVAFDAKGRVVLANDACAERLGARPGALVGQRLSRAKAARALGPWAEVPLGSEGRLGLVALTRSLPTDPEYQIRTSPRFGVLVPGAPFPDDARVDAPGKNGAATCYEMLAGQHRPCGGCPARELSGPEPRTSIVRIAGARDLRLRCVTAQRIDATTARVSAREVPDSTFAELLAARVDWLAERARLTGRERAVLERALVGVVPKDLAAELGISVRTVKFHSANIRRKLGVGSLAELWQLRVVRPCA